MVPNIWFEKTTIGELGVEEENEVITHIYFDRKHLPNVYSKHKSDLIDTTFQELNLYLSGRLKSFSIPYRVKGSEFKKLTLEIVAQIPYGETRTYKEISEIINKKNASRAVGKVMNTNPLPLIIPCHRVIGSDGKLVGYSGGLEVKSFLLKMEKSSMMCTKSSYFTAIKKKAEITKETIEEVKCQSEFPKELIKTESDPPKARKRRLSDSTSDSLFKQQKISNSLSVLTCSESNVVLTFSDKYFFTLFYITNLMSPSTMKVYPIDPEGILYLKSKEDPLSSLIERYQNIQLHINTNIFEFLIDIILVRNLNLKAGLTLRKRMNNILEEVTPESVMEHSPDYLCQINISNSKAECIYNIAQSLCFGSVPSSADNNMSDSDLYSALTQIDGIGPFYADMLIVFLYQRSNYWCSHNKLLMRGIEEVYGIESLSSYQFSAFEKKFSPYCSLAELFIYLYCIEHHL